MKKILPFICTMFISFSAWGVTCDAGYYLPDGADECVICPAGKYSEAGASSCSNVSAGYFCSGGCTTATPTSDEDCLTGNTCGQCLTDSVTGREAYSGAGAASCSVCPEVTGELASRVVGYKGWWSGDIHKSISGCIAYFKDDDPDATYRTSCYYSDGTYGGANSKCETRTYNVDACAAGKYNTITSASAWNEGNGYATCRGVDCLKGEVCTDTTAGYYSPEGAKTQTACPAGTYSAAGAGACTNASAGYYTTGCTDGTTCTGQSQCTGTTYCADGVQYSCPTGYTENTTDGKSSVTQCQTTCPAGNYMANGTYTQLEYLTSSGTQYIDTGVVFDSTKDFHVVSQFINPDASKRKIILGNYPSYSVLSLEFDAHGKLRTYTATSNSNSTETKSSETLPTNTMISYDMYYNATNHTEVTSWQYGNTNGSFQGATVVTAPGLPLRMFLDHRSSFMQIKNPVSIGTTEMYKDNVLVANFVPVRRNSDSVLGMLDLVSGQFLTNAGTGTFTAGPDIAQQIGGTCSDTSTAGHYATAKTIGYGTPAPQTACPAGTYSAAVGASSASTCTACPAGEYSAAGASTCTACPTGTYSATTGAAVCSNPAIGYYASGCTDGTACTGQSQCTGTTYCADGVQYSCPTGYTANTTTGKSAVSQCQATCSAGNYMANGAYTQLEYLQSSGTQYINTGIKTSYGLVVTARFSTNVEKTILFGGRIDWTNGTGIAWGYIDGTTAFNMYGGTNGSTALTKSVTDNQQHTIVLSPTGITLDGVAQAHNTFGDQVGSNDIYLFTWNNAGTADTRMWQGKVYGFSIADANGNMVRDMIPARRNSDNVLGMLDLVSGQFLTNAGTGTFTAGSDVAQIGGTCTDASSAGYYATATTIGYGTPALQTACPVGTFAPTASPVCYPHRLHIGDDVVYVQSTKLTTPSLNIDIDRDGVADFFVNMTTTRTRMNKDSEHYFHAQWENNDYYICDDTTCPQ